MGKMCKFPAGVHFPWLRKTAQTAGIPLAAFLTDI